MTRFALISQAALASALVLACAEDSVNPTAAPVTSPAMEASVLRQPADISDFLVDEEAGLSILIGLTYERLVEACNTGVAIYDPSTLLLVGRPDGSLKLQLTAKDVNVLVFEGVLASDDCETFLSAGPLATGTVNASLADNDFFLSGNRSNSFHLMLAGAGTYTGTGEPVHIRVKLQGLTHKDFSGRFSVEIRLH